MTGARYHPSWREPRAPLIARFSRVVEPFPVFEVIECVIRRAAILVASVLVALGCAGPVAGSPTPASVTKDGVRLTLELDHGEIMPGDLLWATLVIENTNDYDVKWRGSGCKVPGNVLARPEQPDAGRQWSGALGGFKSWALRNGETYANFVVEEHWNLAKIWGGVACPAAEFVETMAAKTTLRTRWVWDGMVNGGFAGTRPAPTGPLDVVGSFTLAEGAATNVVQVTSPLRVGGRGDPYLSAGVAIDRAYDDGRLARWLQGRPEPTTRAGVPVGAIVGSARLDADAWVIIAAQKTGPAPHEIEVRLGADDGKVRSVIER